ncbi:CubicO group peptidase, beta-lactamase class C family [Sinomicrobium oceani]|uniref:CubicO group peptidase, beta-lactamase class C family n=1 Tax=Sinomicrobium oceani TaxID=1150368 RepID=A0A1K1MZ09_9FLAO|nr:serine hydrolase [Sinomicrobium oceani]SFW28418.1 CubicO group peptidase, beta-lactamase class C family [Sinomicrobium oceani]
MKVVKAFFKWLLIVLITVIAGLYLFGYGYLIKAVVTIYGTGHTTAYLEDYTAFDNRTIAAGKGQPWPIHKNYNKTHATENLEAIHKKLGTVAFLIIKNDSLWFEKYYEDYDIKSRSNSFSMAKSIVSAMLGKAIMEGKIKSLDQPVSDFFPEFSEGTAARLTVGDLSSMSSGLNWDESYYSPFSVTTRAYFDHNLREIILGLRVTEQPGESYKYLSGNTELLAMVLEKATGRTLSGYLSEKFWKPLGAESDAFWQLDSEKDGLEKAYCCIASNARDFARFGKLYKDYGVWNGEQLLDSAFISKSITPRFADAPHYGYGFWLSDYNHKKVFYMNGHLGQYVITIPEDNIIIVRLGHRKEKHADKDPHSEDFYAYIRESYHMLNLR